MMIVLFTSRPLMPIASAVDLLRLVDEVLQRRLDPDVVDLVAVVREDDVDEVLADVVDVALDRADHDDALAAGVVLLHVRLEVGDRGLHRLRALQHERQLHLAAAEEVADDLHALEQHVVDDRQRGRPPASARRARPRGRRARRR